MSDLCPLPIGLTKSINLAVKSGFFWGYSGLIDKIVNLIKKETKRSYKLIITGTDQIGKVCW